MNALTYLFLILKYLGSG